MSPPAPPPLHVLGHYMYIPDCLAYNCLNMSGFFEQLNSILARGFVRYPHFQSHDPVAAEERAHPRQNQYSHRCRYVCRSIYPSVFLSQHVVGVFVVVDVVLVVVDVVLVIVDVVLVVVDVVLVIVDVVLVIVDVVLLVVVFA